MRLGDNFLPQANPLASYLAHKAEIDEALSTALSAGHYILGEQVQRFEQDFGEYLGNSFVIGTASGTDALHLALLCCGIGQGDIVITVSHTAVATVAAIHLAGAIPAFVDIDPVTFTMSPTLLEEAVSELRRQYGDRVKAVIPVHLYGTPAEVQSVRKISDEHNLYLIEDCAQSNGATLFEKKTGTWGHLSAFSFYPTKNLGALGDGGAIATTDPSLAEKARCLREYGWKERYISSEHGMNTRLDELQAAVLNVKLKYLDEENQRRNSIASLYKEILTGLPVILPATDNARYSVHHQFVLRAFDRDSLKNFLQENSIGTAVHYPQPVHLQPAYKNQWIATSDKLLETERACQEILSLPIYPQLRNDEVIRVAETIRSRYQQI